MFDKKNLLLRTKALEEESTLGFLPHRLRTEIAIHVHLETLKKVKISIQNPIINHT